MSYFSKKQTTYCRKGKKIIFRLFIIFIFLLNPVMAHAQQGDVLRGFIWGLPSTVLLENEKGTFVDEEEGRIFYIDDIEIGKAQNEPKTVRATIGYDFTQDQLWRARLFIEKKYVDPRERLNDLIRLRHDLAQQYGDPVDEIMVWHDKKEQGWPESWGWAILRGELMMTLLFENDETIVRVFMGAKEKLNPNLEDPQFNITYVSKAHTKSFKSDKSENLLNLP